jgi:hypothetical protein
MTLTHPVDVYECVSNFVYVVIRSGPFASVSRYAKSAKSKLYLSPSPRFFAKGIPGKMGPKYVSSLKNSVTSFFSSGQELEQGLEPGEVRVKVANELPWSDLVSF